MIAHMNYQHRFEEAKCPKCNRIFGNPGKLRSHLQNHKRYSANLECLICNMKLFNSQSLKGHVENVHSTEKAKITFLCDICGLNYYSKSLLNIHMINKHSRPYKCFDEYCTERFNYNTSRKSHYLSFHSSDLEKYKILERKERFYFPYKCPYESCNKKFKDKQSMLQHHRTHSMVRIVMV